MSKIYLKPKVGEVVIWESSQGRVYADTVMLLSDEDRRYRYSGRYLRRIYLRGGCMIDQRMIIAVLPAGTIIDQCTFDSDGFQGYTRSRKYARS